MEPSEELRAITTRYIEAYRDGDVEALSRRDSEGPGTLFVGTDDAEVWSDPSILHDVLRRQFHELGGGYPITSIGDAQAWREGTIGWSWITFTWSTEVGETESRLTTVFRLEHGEWRVVHFHTSVAFNNEEIFGRAITTSIETVAEQVLEERPDLSRDAATDGTVTLVFTDIVDSTRITDLIGDRAWLEVLERHNGIVTSATRQSGGSVVKHTGDGYLLAFSSARRALISTRAIQRAIADSFDDPGSPIRVRIGVHTGEVLRHDADIYGTAVNQAARIAAAADGGQIFTSGIVEALVSGDHDLVFTDGPEVTLKGLEGTHRLRQLVWS